MRTHDVCVECGELVYPEFDPGCYGEFGDEDCMCGACHDAVVMGQEMDQKLDDPRRRAL